MERKISLFVYSLFSAGLLLALAAGAIILIP